MKRTTVFQLVVLASAVWGARAQALHRDERRNGTSKRVRQTKRLRDLS